MCHFSALEFPSERSVEAQEGLCNKRWNFVYGKPGTLDPPGGLMGGISSQVIDEITSLMAHKTEVLAAPSWAGPPDPNSPGE